MCPLNCDATDQNRPIMELSSRLSSCDGMAQSDYQNRKEIFVYKLFC